MTLNEVNHDFIFDVRVVLSAFEDLLSVFGLFLNLSHEKIAYGDILDVVLFQIFC